MHTPDITHPTATSIQEFKQEHKTSLELIVVVASGSIGSKVQERFANHCHSSPPRVPQANGGHYSPARECHGGCWGTRSNQLGTSSVG